MEAAPQIDIIDYQTSHQAAYAALNYAWIEKHFTVEDEDRKALDHPEEKILKPGGAILLAQMGEAIVGTVALIPMPDNALELAKMTVAANARQMGIGNMLGKAAIEKARELGASRIYLESSNKLPEAIRLYFKLGFLEIKGHPSPYQRCNIQMEMRL